MFRGHDRRFSTFRVAVGVATLLLVAPWTGCGDAAPPPPQPSDPAPPAVSPPPPSDPAPEPVRPEEGTRCASDEATREFLRGYEAQQDLRTDDALAAYRKCLEAEPDCVACLYEIGWSAWAGENWAETVSAWQRVLDLDSRHEEARKWLPRAVENLQLASADELPELRVPIGTRSEPQDAPIRLELVARFQSYRSRTDHPADRYDRDVRSPKSATFSKDGSKVYVNSLEGLGTVIYDAATLEHEGVVSHRFGEAEAPLFFGQDSALGYAFLIDPPEGDPNRFAGKPVEGELSHDGRWLWVPYYRRLFDVWATSPSAVAIIDTEADAIVRVMPTGPIPKYVAASPDGRWVAVVHWGDNTVGLIDTSSADPERFEYAAHLVVEEQVALGELRSLNRDRECGFCLRGATFTPDGATLLVGRMSGGGIAGFDVDSHRYLGTVLGMEPTPRHLLVSRDGRRLFLSSSVSGSISRIGLDAVVDALYEAGGKRVILAGWESVSVGGGARTIVLSPDDRYLLVAVNNSAQVAVVDTSILEIVSTVRTDGFPVGLALAPDGGQVWVTSQGRSGRGGNSVCIFRVETADPPG